MFNYVKCLLIVFALLLSLFAKTMEAGYAGEKINIETNENLLFINKCNNKTIVVGDNGTIILSQNGQWSISPSVTNNSLYGVCFGNGIYVAVGDNGTILFSADGISWSNQNSGTNTDLRSVIYGNEMFLVVGTNNVLLMSQDGVNWTQKIPDFAENVELFDGAVFAEGRFLLSGLIIIDGVDVSTCGTHKLYSSTNGDSWTSYDFYASCEKLDMFSWHDIGKYVAVKNNSTLTEPESQILTSNDGINWEFQSTHLTYGIDYSVITYCDLGVFGILGSRLCKSEDGKELHCMIDTILISEPKSFIWDDKEFVAVGAYGEIFVYDVLVHTTEPFFFNTKNSEIPKIKIIENSFVYQVPRAANFEMSIFDLHGKLLYKKSHKYSEQGVFHEKIPSGIVSGTYLARFKTAKQNSAVKFVVDKHN